MRDVIEWLNSPEGTRWSRQNHFCSSHQANLVSVKDEWYHLFLNDPENGYLVESKEVLWRSGVNWQDSPGEITVRSAEDD